MKKITFFCLLLLVISMNGCVQHSYYKQESALIVFNTPTFKYADMGFIYEGEEEIKVEIYSSGQPLTSLRMSHGQVCMSTLQCMSESKFNEAILSRYYPEALLRNVFGGKAILGKQGYKLSRNGFTQKILKSGKYDIEYTVLNREVIFRDRINDILIKVKQQG